MMAGTTGDLFLEDNFHSFNNGSATIYGVTSLSRSNGTDELLVAVLKGKIISYTLKKLGGLIAMPELSEVNFKHMPVDASFLSIDCFRFGAESVAIAVAYAKDANGKQSHFLNIYSICAADCSSTSTPSELDQITNNFVAFDLEFVPYQLTHCRTKEQNGKSSALQPVLLLLGGDCKVHVYTHTEDQGDFSEKNLDNFFPEFKNMASVPLWVDIKISSNEKRRISAIGEASGEVSLFVTDLTSDEWKVVSHSIQCNSPVTSVRLFSKRSSVNMPAFMTRNYKLQENILHEEYYHLLVTCSREPTMVYCFCEDQGFQLPVLLNQSSDHDCVTCSAIADVNRDGKNDIVIGTYGQEIMVYEFKVPDLPAIQDYDPCCPTVIEPMWSRKFSFPIINITFLDLNGDGLEELAVVSAKGLHVLQCDTKNIIDECIRKLGWLKRFRSKN